MNLGVIGYSSAAAAFLILAIMLLTSWRGRLQGAILVVAVIISILWAASAAYITGLESTRFNATYLFFSVLRNVAWITFLFRLLGPLRKSSEDIKRKYRYIESAVIVFAAAIIFIDLFPFIWMKYLPALPGTRIHVVSHLIFAIIGLGLIEQLFRKTMSSERWAVKYLYLGVGGLFVYDFYMYADALLFKNIDINLWQARGYINALIVPLIAISASRNPEWSLKVFVSQRAIFHTAALMGAGLYLIFMAGAGYYIRVYGGTWGGALQTVFLFFAILMLIVILYSGQMRARARIFFSKHFFNYKYDYRDEWLALSKTLTAGDLGLRERPIRALADIVDSPGGVLWTKTEAGHYSCAANWNMSVSHTEKIPPDSSLIRFLENRHWIIDLKEFEHEIDDYNDLEIPDWLSEFEDAWLVIPLIQNEILIGFIVITESRAPRYINWEDRDLLKTVGLQVANYIHLIETTEALTNARQFEAFNRLSSYVVHDLKNVSAQLGLIVSNSKRHKDNPDFIEDAFKTVENATNKMNRMLAQLRKGGKEDSTKSIVNVPQAIREAVSCCGGRLPMPVVEVYEENILGFIDHDKVVDVFTHLIQNAQEATEDNGDVKININFKDEEANIDIIDTGCGMNEQFIQEQLFRPFSTTKGNAGMGIGVYESREFIWSQGGDMQVNSTEGYGTTFAIRLPLYKDAPDQQENKEKTAIDPKNEIGVVQ